MINTLNETHLHHTLKMLYKAQNPGSTEETPVPTEHGKPIADLVTKDGSIIEIQTQSLSHLAEKVDAFLNQGRCVTIVYPLACIKYIETYEIDKTLKRRKKSPLKKNIYSIFKELTALYSFLLHKNFRLEVLECIIVEERTETLEKVQSANGRRRFPKNWLKTGKRLESIEKTRTFSTKKDYLALFPNSLNKEFSVADIKTALKESGVNVKDEEIRLMLWVYTKMALIERKGKKGRTVIYALKGSGKK